MLRDPFYFLEQAATRVLATLNTTGRNKYHQKIILHFQHVCIKSLWMVTDYINETVQEYMRNACARVMYVQTYIVWDL